MEWAIISHAFRRPHFISIVEHYVKEHGTDEEIQNAMRQLSEECDMDWRDQTIKKLSERVRVLGVGREVGFVEVTPNEAWSNAALEDIKNMPREQKAQWYKLFAKAASLTSSKPSKKWLTETKPLLDDIGQAAFLSTLEKWFGLIGKKGTFIEPPRLYEPDKNEIIGPTNAAILKGLAWAASLYDEPQSAQILGHAALACFKKVPMQGPRCPKVGNACVGALSSMSTNEAIVQLAKLKASAKHASSKSQIEKGLGNAAERSGTTVEDLEEQTTPSFGFVEVGRLVKEFGDARAELCIAGGACILNWHRNNEVSSKVPADVKRDFPEQLKALKKTVAEADKFLPVLRQRLEGSWLGQRHWSLEIWKSRYLNHPVCGALTRNLIWSINGKALAWSDGNFVDAHDNRVALDELAIIELWHPISAEAQEVLDWRQWLRKHNITQPFKQAHREIYVLTDAERTTATYSNRFAAHIIRQHQFAELLRQRGWIYTLQGQWDSHNVPTLHLPKWELNIEFWVEPVENDHVSQASIYMALSTDQVRFLRPAGQTVQLTEVLPLVFSEVMRDVDLFVGVCSIGNDPNWHDGGNRFGDYWQGYSFGDLGASALTRKEVLEQIVPHLKIADRCSFEDKFVVVKGDLRTYKIHLGSGNILMEPNNAYLCIVPSRGQSAVNAGTVMLPFEGDNMLSIILSKCFLLAEDKKITDPSILSQIKMK